MPLLITQLLAKSSFVWWCKVVVARHRSVCPFISLTKFDPPYNLPWQKMFIIKSKFWSTIKALMMWTDILDLSYDLSCKKRTSEEEVGRFFRACSSICLMENVLLPTTLLERFCPLDDVLNSYLGTRHFGNEILNKLNSEFSSFKIGFPYRICKHLIICSVIKYQCTLCTILQVISYASCNKAMK